MVHNFKDFPELTDRQMQEFYFESPHKQIFENFRATVIKVHDGDTITLRWDERDFDFPMRIVEIDAPELNVEGGHRSRDYLAEFIEGEEVEILIDPKQRVEKWGRLLGDILVRGIKISEDMVIQGMALHFNSRREGELPNIDKEMNIKNWLKT